MMEHPAHLERRVPNLEVPASTTASTLGVVVETVAKSWNS